MKLSIGMMVKNEEKYLEQCLSSLMPILDKIDSELIVVDTGSNDKTVEIAKKYTNKVYFHEWNNNFAEMRNISISYCSGEWFFCIDGDEILEDCNEIVKFFNSGKYKNYNSAIVNTINIMDLSDANNFVVCKGLRLFKIDQDFKYVGSIHNQPVYKGPTAKLNANIKHYGYVASDKDLMEKKFKRTSNLLKRELDKDPENIYYMYQLSVSFAMHGDKEEAVTEIERCYNCIKENKIDLSQHLYVLQQLCSSYFNINDYLQAAKYSKEWLKYESAVMDVYYFLGSSEMMLSNNKEAIKYLEKYIELVENKSDIDDISVLNYTIGKIDEVYYNLALLNGKINNNEKALNYLKKIKSNKYNVAQEAAAICFRNKYYNGLYSYYTYLIEKEDNDKINMFLLCIEGLKLHLDKVECNKIDKLFTDGNNLYSKLNVIRVNYQDKKDNLIDDIKVFISYGNMDKLPDYFGDIVFYLISLKEELADYLSKVSYKVLNSYFEYAAAKYDDFSDKVYRYLEAYGDKEDFNSLKINKELFRYVILLNKLDNEQFRYSFLKYIDIGIKYINIVYSPFILENEIYQECRTEEEEFFILIGKAKQYEKSDKKLYLQYLRNALEVYPNMKDGIKLFLKEVNDISDKQDTEMEENKIKVKKNISGLINTKNIAEAKKLIGEYESIIKDDPEIISMKAVILIMDGKIQEAELILKEGLVKNSHNFDLNYNLAYIYEQTREFDKAIKSYNIAEDCCNDNILKEDIVHKIEKIRASNPELINASQLKMAFFVKQGMDNFLDNIIEGLSDEYDTKKIVVTEYCQVDEGMEWADICWFEWCDELVAYGSKHKLANEKKIICRLHSYEAFTDYPLYVNWNTIDVVVFVAEHIRTYSINKFRIDRNKTQVIANGVNIKKYKFMNKKPGFNIAYVGYINYKKGPMLLLHTFKTIYDKDHRYKLYIAGQFQDDRFVLYFNQMIREFGLDNNVIFQGWQNDLDKWLDDKDYIICSSVLESQNMSVMQAMSKGIKPVIHNFVGAKTIYDTAYIWNTANEAVKIIEDKNYNSKEYHEFIKCNYSLEKEIINLKKLLINVSNSKKNTDPANLNRSMKEDSINFIYNGKRIKFYLPYLNDWIQKVIYETNNFYEIVMLEDVKNRIRKGSVIIDIGANIGNHTIFFSKICDAKKVYAFEPQKNIFEILKKNVEINEVDNIVELYNMGVGKEHIFANVMVLDRNNYGMSRLNKTEKGNIEIDSLDYLLMNKVAEVDAIKIDVEGMELEVLEGAKNIINKFKPLIYIEAGTDEEFKSVSEFLNYLYYKPLCKFNATPTYLFIYSNSQYKLSKTKNKKWEH